MKKMSILWLLSVGFGGYCFAQTPVDLRCDHLERPLGIDNPAPRLTWRIDDSRPGARQSAWRIVVDSDSAAVARGEGRMWDSGRSVSARQLVEYGGQPLRPFTRYYWRVTAWDRDSVPAVSAIASFETGMMEPGNWQGAWIGDGHGIDYRPAPYFRTTFDTESQKQIASARVYIAVGGLYELYLNGLRVGDRRLDPMYTRFDRRTLYTTFDVTSLLSEGRNAIGVLLGNGWYNHQSLAVWDFHRAPWRNRPTFCLDLRITYADGTTQVVSTDRNWRTTTDGPLVFNSIYTGEHYDARRELSGWSTAAFDDSDWRTAGYRAAPSGHIVAQQLHPIRAVDTLRTRTIRRLDDSTVLFDFGLNMSGVTRVRAAGEAGTRIRIRHGERLDSTGRLDLSNIDLYHRPADATDPFATDLLTLSGRPEGDDFSARFNYKGFRYVEAVSDRPVAWDTASIEAYFVHSDVPQRGWIEASEPMIERLWRATNRSYLSNLMGYPTDCPQREKNGWTGDGHFAIETALYNFDAITIYEKWLADHRDEQQPNGVLPDIIPTGGWGYGTDNGTDWTSTIAIIPWNLYLFYGDPKPLADCYEAIKRYVDYIDRHSPEGLTSWGRGDWVPVRSSSSKELTSSVYYYVDARILSDAARIFGREEDHAHYSALAERIRTAINDKYLDRERAIYAGGSQTELSVPLRWGVVPPELARRVARNLAQRVAAEGYHLDVGVLGAKALLDALTANGEAQTAYRLAVQDTYPSWGHWIARGATTLHENWNMEATRDISDNHMMFGEIGAWFYKGLGGIYPDPERPGFEHILLRPNFPEGLERFGTSFRSPYGEIRVRWERRRNRVSYFVRIPANSCATLQIPEHVSGIADRSVELEAGEHRFDFRLKASK